MGCLTGRSTSVLLTAQERRAIWGSIRPSAYNNHKDKQSLKLPIVCWHKIKTGPPWSSLPDSLVYTREKPPAWSVSASLFCCWDGNKLQQSSSRGGRSNTKVFLCFQFCIKRIESGWWDWLFQIKFRYKWLRIIPRNHIYRLREGSFSWACLAFNVLLFKPFVAILHGQAMFMWHVKN